MGHHLVSLLGHDGIGDQELVLKALLDAQLGNDLVLERVGAEAEGWVSADNVVEELSALLHLQVVSPVQGSLVHARPQFSLKFDDKRTSLGFPSPELTKMSRANTSWTLN